MTVRKIWRLEEKMYRDDLEHRGFLNT